MRCESKEIEDLNKEPEETVETVEEPPEPVVVLPSEAADSDTRWPIHMKTILLISLLVAVGSSGILKGKQKLGVTFNFNKQDIIDFVKFSKMTMCRASEFIKVVVDP